MSFGKDHEVLSLIKNQDNNEAKTLIRNGNLHDAFDISKNTLLHFAAEYQNPEVVQFLIDLGADVNATNGLGQTPLVKSFESDLPCKQVIEILLKAGAYVCRIVIDITGKTLLNKLNSIEWLNEDIIRFEVLKLCIEYGIIQMDLSDLSVLHKGSKEVIKMLLQTNLNLSATDVLGNTVVHMLALNHSPGVVELLRGKNFDINARDFFGWTPLMGAANSCNISAVEFLLNEGADIQATNIYGGSALYMAIADHIGRQPNIKTNVQILLEHGANVQLQIIDDQEVEDIDELPKTIFDLFLGEDQELSFQVAKLLLAHLALQERLGMTITELIREKINEDQRFKNYFEYCQQQLSVAIYLSFTLFDLLTASDKQFERFFGKENLASGLIDIQTEIEYFYTILSKRISKSSRIIKLKIGAAQIVCKLMKMNYDCYPSIIDGIVNYMGQNDHEYLISIENNIC